MPTKLTPYLSFNGNTREAFSVYEKRLDGTIKTMMSYDDLPPELPCKRMSGVMVAIEFDSEAQATEDFEAPARYGSIEVRPVHELQLSPE